MSSPSTPVCVQRCLTSSEDELAYAEMTKVLNVLGYDQDFIHHHILCLTNAEHESEDDRSRFAEYVFVKKAGSLSLYDSCKKPLKVVDGLGRQSISRTSLYDILFDVFGDRAMWLKDVIEEQSISNYSRFIHTISFDCCITDPRNRCFRRVEADDMCIAALPCLSSDRKTVIRYILEFDVLSFIVVISTDESIDGYQIYLDNEIEAVSALRRLITAAGSEVTRMI